MVFGPLGLVLGMIAMGSDHPAPWTIAFFAFAAFAGIVASTSADGLDESLKRPVITLLVSWVVVVAIAFGYQMLVPKL